MPPRRFENTPFTCMKQRQKIFRYVQFFIIVYIICNNSKNTKHWYISNLNSLTSATQIINIEFWNNCIWNINSTQPFNAIKCANDPITTRSITWNIKTYPFSSSRKYVNFSLRITERNVRVWSIVINLKLGRYKKRTYISIHLCAFSKNSLHAVSDYKKRSFKKQRWIFVKI